MKIYICWSVPDYIGIDIEGIFLKEEDAKAYCDFHNPNRSSHDYISYDEYPVYESFDGKKGEE